MMEPIDFVYMETYRQCKNSGCDELSSKNAAIVTLQKYKNNQFTKISKLINNFFILLLKLEGFLLQYFNFPFGTSIICLAQKPK